MAACESIPDTSKIELQKDSIKSVAVLPLVLGDGNNQVEGGLGAETEIAGLMAYWQENFSQIKYAGTDFVKAIPAYVDYGELMEELGVDAVLGFNVLSYNETQMGTGLVLGLLGAKETADASFRLHFHYLHQEDWAPFIFATPVQGAPRESVVSQMLNWLDENWPLSVDYKKKPSAQVQARAANWLQTSWTAHGLST